MERQVLQGEMVNEREQTSRLVVLVMFIAVAAWLVVAIAQCVVFCGGLFGGFRR